MLFLFCSYFNYWLKKETVRQKEQLPVVYVLRLSVITWITFQTASNCNLHFKNPCHCLLHLGKILLPLIDILLYFRGKIGGKEDTWHLRKAGASIKLCSGAVQQPVPFTCRCQLWNPKSLSPPVASDEILVSSVIELSHDGPSNLEYRENFEGISFNVALLHSAPYLEGYEVVIKQLTDQVNNEWKELKTENTWHGSGTVMLLWNVGVNELMNDVLRLPSSLASMSVSEQLCTSLSPSPKLIPTCNPNLLADCCWLRRGGVGVHWLRY